MGVATNLITISVVLTKVVIRNGRSNSHFAQPFIDFGVPGESAQLYGSELVESRISLLQIDLRFDDVDLLL